MSLRSPMERALASPGYIRLRGFNYCCRPLKLKHFAEAKAFLVHLAPDPLKELIEEKETFNGFPEHVQKALAIEALHIREQRKTSLTLEASNWINGEEGLLFLFWCMVRDNYPKLASFEEVLKLFPPDDEDKSLSIPEADMLRKKIDELCGMTPKPQAPAGKPAGSKKKKMKKTRR